MLIGILETGIAPNELSPTHGTYSTMFQQLLGGVTSDWTFKVYKVLDLDLPQSPQECEGWLITGSRHGVYDNLPWIEPLKAFIREIHAAKQPLIGICFGHQIIAEALGGKVVKSPKGWGLGLHEYEVKSAIPHLPETEAVGQLKIHAMHQDQVVQLPPDAKVLASSEFCEYAGLVYGDHIFTLQGHPEFSQEFEEALIRLRTGAVFPKEKASEAIETMTVDPDTKVLAQWMASFFQAQRP
ncbi:MAG: hypothetical protein RLZZ422_2027 [Pseudomonadota bacterium]|jgi:GMP synthase-like glutamine amidotransferase